jgi:preprotein translocase subunit SecY
MVISELGFLIYGAIYWHSIADSFGKIHRSETCDLPLLVDLAQYTWILALIVPGVAPAVCAIAVIRHTSESQCTMHKQMFEEQYLTGMNPEFSQYWNGSLTKKNQSLNWTSEWFLDWFSNRCALPHFLFALFLGMFLYVIFVILITFIYIWTRTDPPVAKQTG